jgi:hypothetical protein
MRHTSIMRALMLGGVASCAVGGMATLSASEKARIKSRFTTIELSSCEAVKMGAERAAAGTSAWTCKGLSGYPVYVAEDGFRQFISFGVNGRVGRAAKQTLKASSSVFTPEHGRATIEWRFRRADGRDVPYATIMRFHTSGGSKKVWSDGDTGEVLVVSKVTPSDACHLALIDARANSDAILLARSAADELSADFDCRTDQPRVVGATGRSPM